MNLQTAIRDLTKPEDIQLLNSILSELAEKLDVLYTTTAPNGTISARIGKIALYNNSGSYERWQNIDGGTTWERMDYTGELWEIDGTETQLKTSDEIDMQSKKIINLAAPANVNDAARKTDVDSMGQSAGGDLTGTYPNPTIADGKVDTAALKTSSGEVSTTTDAHKTLPGGTYGFYPQIKVTTGSTDITMCSDGVATAPTSYTTNVSFYNTTGTAYAQQYYVTASGDDLWVFLLLDKNTKEIISAYQAPDHPAYGNGGDYDKRPHPFTSFDEATQEIVLLDKETCLALKQESEETGKSILTLVNEEYKPDMNREEAYQPLHSGKYIIQKDTEEIVKHIPIGDDLSKYKQIKELVKTIPDYIKVRKLLKMTGVEKEEKAQRQEQKIQVTLLAKSQKKERIKIKLNLTEEEFLELKEALR